MAAANQNNVIIRRNLQYLRYYHYPVIDIINYLDIVLNDPHTYDHERKYNVLKLYVERFLLNIAADYIFYEHNNWWKVLNEEENIQFHAAYLSEYNMFRISCLEFELNFKDCKSVEEFINIYRPFKNKIESMLDVSEKFFVNIQTREWKNVPEIANIPTVLSNYYELFLQRHANYLIPLLYHRFHMPRYTHREFYRGLHWTYKFGFTFWYVRQYRKRYMDFILDMSKTPRKKCIECIERTAASIASIFTRDE
jgi:hypothetical protein